MTSKKIKIELTSGLQARPAAMLECEAKRVNAKSIMGMMTLELSEGESVNVTADGKDEERALEGIEKYLSNN